MKTIKMVAPFAKELNLYGELYSLAGLKQLGNKMEIETEIIFGESRQNPFPDDADLLFFGPGEVSTLLSLLPVLQDLKPKLLKFLEKGGQIIVVGSTGILFGNEFELLDQDPIKGIGLLPMKAKELKNIHADDCIFVTTQHSLDIIGEQIQRFDFETDSPLGTVKYGYGNHGGRDEGCISSDKQIKFTNCLGPLFIKNPWFGQDILKELLQIKKSSFRWFSYSDFPVENKAFNAFVQYVKNK